MNFEVLALDIGGRRIDLGSLTDVRVKVAGDHWNVSFRLERGGTLDQFLLTTTGDLDSEVQVRSGGRPLAGHGHVAQYNAPGCNTIEVWIVGDSALRQVPEVGQACDVQPQSAPDRLLADGWREIEG